MDRHGGKNYLVLQTGENRETVSSKGKFELKDEK